MPSEVEATLESLAKHVGHAMQRRAVAYESGDVEAAIKWNMLARDLCVQGFAICWAEGDEQRADHWARFAFEIMHDKPHLPPLIDQDEDGCP